LQGGPMDYTPGIFEADLAVMNPNDPQKMQITIANQLALYVVMYSPLQMAADLPEHYAKHMDAFQFIKDVALDWEKSVYLLAEPGAYIVTARKEKASEGRWFIGGVTDESAREVSFPLDFLDPRKTYTATIYADAPDASGVLDNPEAPYNPQAYVITEKEVSASDSLSLRMAPAGGFAICLKAK
ncbi:MAG: glycoside hydrolase family 97 C-terminal domain-containing protein, partial [Bacteroidales bacterium]|nr:glycoside hydrolase family 97 C-terminal domain-containing protein [Bacteroidales bacterium]